MTEPTSLLPGGSQGGLPKTPQLFTFRRGETLRKEWGIRVFIDCHRQWWALDPIGNASMVILDLLSPVSHPCIRGRTLDLSSLLQQLSPTRQGSGKRKARAQQHASKLCSEAGPRHEDHSWEAGPQGLYTASKPSQAALTVRLKGKCFSRCLRPGPWATGLKGALSSVTEKGPCCIRIVVKKGLQTCCQ